MMILRDRLEVNHLPGHSYPALTLCGDAVDAFFHQVEMPDVAEDDAGVLSGNLGAICTQCLRLHDTGHEADASLQVHDQRPPRRRWHKGQLVMK